MARSGARKPHSKKKRRGIESAKKKTGGTMIGMRSGFKKVAKSVAGVEEEKSKSGSILGTIVVVVLVAAIAALLFYR